MGTAPPLNDDPAAAFEARLYEFAFRREDRRKRRSGIIVADCGHEIDNTEPYRYLVWRLNCDPRGQLSQRTDCEFCARADYNY